MTFLQLCQALRRESGTQGTGPTTVVAQTDEYAQIVEWIIQAWSDIQSLRDNWKFMWADDFTIDTVVGEKLLDLSTKGVARFNEETFTCFETAVGVSDRQYIGFEPWHDAKEYIRSVATDNQRPSIVTQRPDGDLDLIYPADKIYTINADYYRIPQQFSADADVPTNLPVRYHMAIVYKALFDYGGYEDAPEAVERAKARYAEMISNMFWDQLDEPEMVMRVE